MNISSAPAYGNEAKPNGNGLNEANAQPNPSGIPRLTPAQLRDRLLVAAFVHLKTSVKDKEVVRARHNAGGCTGHPASCAFCWVVEYLSLTAPSK